MDVVLLRNNAIVKTLFTEHVCLWSCFQAVCSVGEGSVACRVLICSSAHLLICVAWACSCCSLGHQREVYYAFDYAANGHNNLSDTIMDKGFAVLKDFKVPASPCLARLLFA